jgi:hypothetical protein
LVERYFSSHVETERVRPACIGEARFDSFPEPQPSTQPAPSVVIRRGGASRLRRRAMGVSVKAEWIDRYNAEQQKRRDDERGRRTQTAMFIA